jgi:hypothetical protein
MDDTARIVLVGDASYRTTGGARAAGEAAPDVLATRLGRDLVAEVRVEGADVED